MEMRPPLRATPTVGTWHMRTGACLSVHGAREIGMPRMRPHGFGSHYFVLTLWWFSSI